MIKHRDDCRGCRSKNITQFLDLGEMPLAGGFLTEEQIKSEIGLPLKVYFCHNCGLVQILDVVDPRILFENYCYISSVIKPLSKHFKNYSLFLKKNYLNEKGSRLLEFGCNDGVLLQHFNKDKTIKTFGVDPSVNVAKIARSKGVNVVNAYFNQTVAKKILKKYGKMDVVTGSNVFAHVDDIHEIIKAVKLLLKPNGVFIIEVHYLGDLLKDFQYDIIYHEHLSYYSLFSLTNIFRLENLKITDIKHLKMHGGAIRVIASLKGSILKTSPSVDAFMRDELIHGVNKIESFLNFGKRCKDHKKNLIHLLKSIKKTGASVVGYGASGRGTVLLNYCKIDKRIIDYIVDVSPLRIGKLVPGVHTPIYSVEKSRHNPPDFFLVTAWNYASSILRQEKMLKKKGVRFIIPFPKIKII